jgi:TPR repeat protein
MRARFLGACVVLALLAGAPGASAQSADSEFSQSIAALKARAESGDSEAQCTLGVNYDIGHGLPQDYAQAAQWFRKAAEQGDAQAQYNLGRAYYTGHGVAKDYAAAYFWLNIAASGNRATGGFEQEDVDKLRDKAATRLTPANLSRTQARARKWFDEHPAKPQ